LVGRGTGVRVRLGHDQQGILIVLIALEDSFGVGQRDSVITDRAVGIQIDYQRLRQILTIGITLEKLIEQLDFLSGIARINRFFVDRILILRGVLGSDGGAALPFSE